MAIEKSSNTNPSNTEQQLAKARQRKSQAKLHPQSQPCAPAPTQAAAQSVAQLQQAQGDFQNFQAAIAAQLQAMQQATVATARQAAEIKNSMPLLFEQEFAARDAELRGTAQAGFPQPQFEPIPAFKVSTPSQLLSASGDATQGNAPKAIAPWPATGD